jgi:hypothetical protein
MPAKKSGPARKRGCAMPHERDQQPEQPAPPDAQRKRAYRDAASARVDTDTRGQQLLQLARRLKSGRS